MISIYTCYRRRPGLSSEQGCWGRRSGCCRCWGERTKEQLAKVTDCLGSPRFCEKIYQSKLTVDSVVVRRVADDGVATAGSKSVLTVDLVLSTIDSVGAGPDINVRLSVVRVGSALLLTD